MSAMSPAPSTRAIVEGCRGGRRETQGCARAAIAEVIFGQETVVERALTTVLAGGHGLLVGVPGLAKTKLVDTMGTVFGLSTTASSSRLT